MPHFYDCESCADWREQYRRTATPIDRMTQHVYAFIFTTAEVAQNSCLHFPVAEFNVLPRPPNEVQRAERRLGILSGGAEIDGTIFGGIRVGENVRVGIALTTSY